MICVGIDVAKDKHDCFILSSEGEILADVFTIQNNAEGFDTLLQCNCVHKAVSVRFQSATDSSRFRRKIQEPCRAAARLL